jgi:hypothetical protein
LGDTTAGCLDGESQSGSRSRCIRKRLRNTEYHARCAVWWWVGGGVDCFCCRHSLSPSLTPRLVCNQHQNITASLWMCRRQLPCSSFSHRSSTIITLVAVIPRSPDPDSRSALAPRSENKKKSPSSSLFPPLTDWVMVPLPLSSMEQRVRRFSEMGKAAVGRHHHQHHHQQKHPSRDVVLRKKKWLMIPGCIQIALRGPPPPRPPLLLNGPHSQTPTHTVVSRSALVPGRRRGSGMNLTHIDTSAGPFICISPMAAIPSPPHNIIIPHWHG